MKKWKTAVLSLCTAAAVAIIPTAPALAAGPGEANTEDTSSLSPGDDFAPYQWALKNTGTLHRRQKQLNLLSLKEIYVHRGENGIDGIALPPLGPSNFETITTDSVAGIDINVEGAWEQYEKTADTRPVVVAVIDTGVDVSHPDLTNSIWVNEDEIPGDGIDNDGNGYIDDMNGWNFLSNSSQLCVGDEDSHGTHTAGTIDAGRGDGGIAGIADYRKIKLMVLKALGGEEGKGSPESVLGAIRYAQANGAQICNLSLGAAAYTEELSQTIRDSNMLFVVAAGNGDQYDIGYNIDETPLYPASFPWDNVLTVANLMFDGTLDDSSNYGPVSVDIAAPGSYILSTVPDNSYAFMSGTSMAAPMVTGAAALIYSARPDLSLLDVKNAIISTAHKLPDLEGKLLSGGMLDVTAAMAWGKPAS